MLIEFEIIMGSSSFSNCNHNNHNMEKALDQLGLELITDLFLEVLISRKKIVFRFFMRAGHQDNYSQEPCACNEMIGILTSTKYKKQQFRIVCGMFDCLKRNNKKVVPAEVFSEIRQEEEDKGQVQSEINAFNLLDALCECSLIKDADVLFKTVKNKVMPGANTYNVLFFRCCRVRNPTREMKVLKEMIQLGLPPCSFTCITSIVTLCRAGAVTKAADLSVFMRTKDSTIMDERFKLLEDMINYGSLPDVLTCKELIEGTCSAINCPNISPCRDSLHGIRRPAEVCREMITYDGCDVYISSPRSVAWWQRACDL
ncbi:pentatricopeptide repeat-containing family protein [Salix suchowensis]|nr:pentatricopeptide repeat-containing family protein [Salix suchowensis]